MAQVADLRPRISELARGYRYPRTIAEMVPVRRAEYGAHAHEIPSCPNGHGRMKPRPLEKQSYESLFSGIWYDCASPHCRSSVTWPSRDLAYERGEPYNNGRGWEKFNGHRWVPISSAEAEAFRVRVEAWDEARQPKLKRLPARHRQATGAAL